MTPEDLAYLKAQRRTVSRRPYFENRVRESGSQQMQEVGPGGEIIVRTIREMQPQRRINSVVRTEWRNLTGAKADALYDALNTIAIAVGQAMMTGEPLPPDVGQQADALGVTFNADSLPGMGQSGVFYTVYIDTVSRGEWYDYGDDYLV